MSVRANHAANTIAKWLARQPEAGRPRIVHGLAASRADRNHHITILTDPDDVRDILGDDCRADAAVTFEGEPYAWTYDGHHGVPAAQYDGVIDLPLDILAEAQNHWALCIYDLNRDVTYTFEEVQEAGNEPGVAFDRDATFRLDTVELDASKIGSLHSYIDERDYRFAHAVLDMILTIEEEGVDALPPVLVDAEGKIADGAHRAAAAVELGITHLPAYIEIGASR